MEANVTKVLRSTAIDCRFRMLEAFLTQTRHERGSVAVSDTAHFLSAAIWTRPSGHASSFLFLFFFHLKFHLTTKIATHVSTFQFSLCFCLLVYETTIHWCPLNSNQLPSTVLHRRRQTTMPSSMLSTVLAGISQLAP